MQCKEILCVVLCLIHSTSCLNVKTNSGIVKGKVTGKGVKFLGIPYAEPPVGNLRWKSPQKKTSWKGIYDATFLRSKCPQLPCKEFMGLKCDNTMSEDCLHLNIYVPPKTNPRSRRAVIIFLHGGLYVKDSSVEPRYNGEILAMKGNIMVVTLNYRIGVLGSLYTDSKGIKGNFAVKDQRLAFKWVHNNIKEFGGDPNRVTIIGQSGAGAGYVAVHLANRMSDRYIRNAIIMSAAFGIAIKTEKQALSIGASFSSNLNCAPHDVDCLRSKSMDEVIDAQSSSSTQHLTFSQALIPWAPFMDGKEVPSDVQKSIRIGLIGVKNVMIGVTANENAQLIMDLFPKLISKSDYKDLISALLPKQAELLSKKYAPKNPQDARPEFTRLTSDVFFMCSSRRVAIDLSKTRRANVWFYVFDNGLKFLKGTDLFPMCQGNSCHGNDFYYLFRTSYKHGFQLSSHEKHLARQFTVSLTNFAKSGNPNIPYTVSKIPWPRYQVSHGWHGLLYTYFSTPNSFIGSDFRGKDCDLFDQNGFYA